MSLIQSGVCPLLLLLLLCCRTPATTAPVAALFEVLELDATAKKNHIKKSYFPIRNQDLTVLVLEFEMSVLRIVKFSQLNYELTVIQQKLAIFCHSLEAASEVLSLLLEQSLPGVIVTTITQRARA